MPTPADPAAENAPLALFSYGFRPFFLSAALWAAVSMALWVAMLSGHDPLPTTLDPLSWHAHEFLFGYLGAVLGGFLTTAVPNWTGRTPIRGWPLAALFVLWLLGRGAIACAALLAPGVVALADLAFPVALAVVMTREILIAGNRRNLVVIALLGLFILANGLFHRDTLLPAQGMGLRLGLGAAVMMIALIGGRILPTFTRNWLAKRSAPARPAPPGRFDALSLAALLATVIAWVGWPEAPLTGAALMLAGALHSLRLARWSGWAARAEPLVWVLHAGYAFVPLGALMLGAAVLWPDAQLAAAAQHIWTAGAVGLMTLAVMTRASLGHTGRPLHAGPGTLALYLCIIGAVALRIIGGLVPQISSGFYLASGLLWIAGFGGFALLYGPMLCRPRLAG